MSAGQNSWSLLDVVALNSSIAFIVVSGFGYFG